MRPGQTEPLPRVGLGPESARRTRHPGRPARRPEPGDLQRRLPRLLDRRRQPLPREGPRSNRSISAGRRRGLPDRVLDGSVAFFSKGGHLYRYRAGGGATDLTPGGGVLGVLGASDDGGYLYYLDGAGRPPLGRRHLTRSPPAPTPTTTRRRPAPPGSAPTVATWSSSLAGTDDFDNRGFDEVYLYTEPEGGGEGTLLCASCTPVGGTPDGASSVPGASANGSGPTCPTLQAAVPGRTAGTSSSTAPTRSSRRTPTATSTSTSGRPRARADAPSRTAASP